MAKDLSKNPWHGVPRQEVPWFPTVDADACIGCELCFVTCGREVYEIGLVAGGRRKAKVDHPYNCMVGCSTCAVVCPTQAISFPSRELVWNVEREYKILKAVHEEARDKRDRVAAITARQRAEAEISKATNRVHVRVAGVFGDKRFLVKLEELLKDRPFDIENLQLSVPTLKGLMENTPAHMSFEVTSTDQGDVGPFVDDLKQLAASNHLVWVEQ